MGNDPQKLLCLDLTLSWGREAILDYTAFRKQGLAKVRGSLKANILLSYPHFFLLTVIQ